MSSHRPQWRERKELKMTETKPQVQPQRATAARYGVSVRTITRWRQNPLLGFPRGIVINAQHYDFITELDRFDEVMRQKAMQS
jgi:hypothetical protein